MKRARAVRVPRAALAWIAGRWTGLSSVAIWSHMVGVPAADPYSPPPHVSYPLDPDDFGRCYDLLAAVPAWRKRIGEMKRYPALSALVPRWDEIKALYLEEWPTRSAPKCYALMKSLLDADRARRAARRSRRKKVRR